MSKRLCVGIAILAVWLLPASTAKSGQNAPPALKDLVEKLKSFDEPIHNEANKKLLELGPGSAPVIPDLIEIMGMGTFHFDGLGAQGKMTGGSILYTSHASAILVKIGPAAVEPLIQQLRAKPAAFPPNQTIAKVAAIHVLSEIKDERAIDPIMQLLRDPGGEVRRAAADALLSFRSPGILDRLAPALNAANVDYRDVVAWIFVHKKDERVFPYIQRKIQSPYPGIRKGAVYDLEAFGGQRAMAMLKALEKDPDTEVREAAAAALKRLQSQGPFSI